MGHDHALDKRLSEPENDSAGVAFGGCAPGRAPRMRNSGTDQHQIAMVIGRNIVRNEPPALTVECERQLVFGMVVPLKRNLLDSAVVKPPRGIERRSQMFAIGFQFEPLLT